jgi:hypothetical protein
MNFSQRLFRYFIGVGIGVILSAFFFKDKSHLWTSWLPGNRVKERIVNSYWDVPEQVACELECLDMDVPLFKSYIQTADVDFKGSDTQGEKKTYQLIFSDSDTLRTSSIAVKDSVATILEIKSNLTCHCP